LCPGLSECSEKSHVERRVSNGYPFLRRGGREPLLAIKLKPDNPYGPSTHAWSNDCLTEASDTNRYKPLVSIIMPFLNVQEYIGEAVRSVMHQSFHCWELIAVDNGSTDDSQRIVAGLQKQDPRVRLINEDRRGVAYAKNLGLRVARGKFIGFIDADDLYDQEKLSVQLRQQYSAVALATALVSRRIIGYHVFDTRLRRGEDWDFFLRVLKGEKSCYLRNPTYYYRMRKNSLTHSESARWNYFDSRVKIYTKLLTTSMPLSLKATVAKKMFWLLFSNAREQGALVKSLLARKRDAG